MPPFPATALRDAATVGLCSNCGSSSAKVVEVKLHVANVLFRLCVECARELSMDLIVVLPGVVADENDKGRHIWLGGDETVRRVAHSLGFVRPRRVVRPEQIEGLHGRLVVHLCGNSWKEHCEPKVQALLEMRASLNSVQIEYRQHATK